MSKHEDVAIARIQARNQHYGPLGLTPAQRQAQEQLARVAQAQQAYLLETAQKNSLAYRGVRARLYRAARRDRQLLWEHYQLEQDQYLRRVLRCQICRRVWVWPINQTYRDAHRMRCLPPRTWDARAVNPT